MSTNKSRRLTLIRHANAEQDSDVRDFERPLSRKGQNEALEMARRFQERGLIPDLILASAATRTRETAETFAKAQEAFGNEQVVDLTITIAFYCAVVRVLGTLKVDVEPDYQPYLDKFPLPA